VGVIRADSGVRRARHRCSLARGRRCCASHQARGEQALARALDTAEERPALTARLAAGQILVVLRTLAHENQMRLAAGESADELAATAIAEADEAIALLAGGLVPFRGA
jgi:hypothetical protein